MATENNRGGSHEQHVKAGQQSHKNTASEGSSATSARPENARSEEKGTRGGSHEQHVKAGQQSHKNN